MKKILISLGLMLISGLAFAGNVTIDWTPPTTCDDGSPITDCPTTGYEIWMGTSQTGTAYTKRTESPAAAAVAITLSAVGAGQKCFYMKTLSSTKTSGESNRVCISVPAPGPRSTFINVTIAIPAPSP